MYLETNSCLLFQIKTLKASIKFLSIGEELVHLIYLSNHLRDCNFVLFH